VSKNSYVSRSGTEKYYISILSEDGKEPPEKQNFDETTTIGIDVGIKDFVVLSNEEKIENPKYLKNSLQRLKCLQKRLSKKQKGSNNRTKARLLLSKIHEK
jgi:putative transposase